MKEATRKAIQKRLNDNSHLSVNADRGLPNNYPNLKAHIVLKELVREKNYLSQLLENPQTFAEQFKERCQWRAENDEYGFAYHEMPESLSNILYWDIATLLFKPATLGEILKIVLPKLKVYIDISFDYLLDNAPASFNEKIKKLEPVITACSVAVLQQTPRLEHLSHYAFTNTHIISIADFCNLPLKLHVPLKKQLDLHYPLLAIQVYTHNSGMHALAADILTFNNRGRTPRSAIEQLIHGLILGGNRITGNVYANQYADEALKQFFAYLKGLSEITCNELMEIKDDKRTLGSIIENEISHGQCVETTATLLAKILKSNTPHPLLDSPPLMTNEDLRILESKYKVTPSNPLIIELAKNSLANVRLPGKLMHNTLRGIMPRSREEFVILILNFPSQLYDILWKHISFTDADLAFGIMGKILHDGFYHPEQRIALVKAITKYYSRFPLRESLLSWLIKIDDPVLLEAGLAQFTPDKKAELATAVDHLGNSPLHYSIHRTGSLQTLIRLIPEEHRFVLFTIVNKHGISALQHAASSPSALAIMMNSLPEGQRGEAVQGRDINGNNLLHKSVKYPNSLKVLLSFIPKSQAWVFFNCKNRENYCSLQLVSLESLKVLAEYLPESKRLALYTICDRKNNPLLHKANCHNGNLLSLLELLEPPLRLAAVETLNTEGNTLLHEVALFPDRFIPLLTAIPIRHRLHALLMLNKKGNTVFHQVVSGGHDYFKEVIALLPAEHLLQAVTCMNQERIMPLSEITRSPQSLRLLMVMAPEDAEWNLLRCRLGSKTVLMLMVEYRIVLPPAKNPFLSELLMVMTFLAERARSQNSLFSLFTTKDAAPLITLIDEAYNYTEIKYHLFEFMSKKPTSALAIELLTRLVPSQNSISMMLNVLRQRWEMNKPLAQDATPLLYADL